MGNVRVHVLSHFKLSSDVEPRFVVVDQVWPLAICCLLSFFVHSLLKLKWKWLTFSPCALFSSLNHWTQSWLSIDPSHNRKTRVWPYLNPQRNERLPSLTSLLNQPQESTVFNHFALIFTTPQQDYQAIKEKIYDRGYQIKMTLFRQELLYSNKKELCRKKSCFLINIPSCICFCGGGCRAHQMFYGIWDRGRFPFSHSSIDFFS